MPAGLIDFAQSLHGARAIQSVPLGSPAGSRVGDSCPRRASQGSPHNPFRTGLQTHTVRGHSSSSRSSNTDRPRRPSSTSQTQGRECIESPSACGGCCAVRRSSTRRASSRSFRRLLQRVATPRGARTRGQGTERIWAWERAGFPLGKRSQMLRVHTKNAIHVIFGQLSPHW